MKLQLASDLHLELLTERFPGVRIIEPALDADLWLHGHVHDSFDYPVGDRCRVAASPAGYVLNRRKAVSLARFGFENGRFKKTLVLELVT